jgi:WD40 repeat protein
VWNLQTGTRTADLPFKVELDAADKAALSPDGRYLASKNRIPGLSVDVWSFEAKTMQARFTLSASYTPLKFIGFVNSRQLVTCPGTKGKQSITVWDLETKQPLHDVDFGQELDGAAIALSPGGRYLAGVQLHKNVLVVIDLLKGKLVEQIVWDNVPGGGFWNSFQGLAFSPDGEELAGLYTADSLRVRVWKMADGKQVFDEPLSIPMHPNLAGYPSYKGRVLEWLPDKSGWVCHGQFVIARAPCRQVMQLRGPKGVLLLPPLRVFPDNQLVFATGQQTSVTLLAKPLTFGGAEARRR